MPKNTKTRRVKGWAVFTKDGALKNATAFEDCSQCGSIADVYGFYLTKNDAESLRSRYAGDRIEKVEITYTLPITKTNKRK